MDDSVILGSHQSATYSPIVNHLGKACSWMLRHQINSIMLQYKIGVRAFEFDLRFYDDDPPVVVNGIAEFDFDLMSNLIWLNNQPETCYVLLHFDEIEYDQFATWFGSFSLPLRGIQWRAVSDSGHAICNQFKHEIVPAYPQLKGFYKIIGPKYLHYRQSENLSRILFDNELPSNKVIILEDFI